MFLKKCLPKGRGKRLAIARNGEEALAGSLRIEIKEAVTVWVMDVRETSVLAEILRQKGVEIGIVELP
jgi:hypothetical protein